MKKILVTGGAGFVGTHLVNELSKNEELEIIVFDNYFLDPEKIFQ